MKIAIELESKDVRLLEIHTRKRAKRVSDSAESIRLERIADTLYSHWKDAVINS